MEYNWNLDPEDENVLIFDDDDQFYNFCVNPKLNIKTKKLETGQDINYYDFDFTHDYNKALEMGKRFKIKDENSQICKHGAVSYRTITKRIDNLDPYYNI